MGENRKETQNQGGSVSHSRQKKGKIQKGEIGYFACEKKKRFLRTLLFFSVPLLIFFSMWIYLKSRETIWTVIAVVGCLPACRVMVGLIMMLPRKPVSPETYARIQSHQGRLVMAYEMYMTFYEKSARIDALAVCGNTAALYSTDEKADAAYMEKHAEEILSQNGYRTDIKLIKNEKIFLDRLDAMNENYDSLQASVKPRKDERYPDLSRDEIVRRLLLDLCL